MLLTPNFGLSYKEIPFGAQKRLTESERVYWTLHTHMRRARQMSPVSPLPLLFRQKSPVSQKKHPIFWQKSHIWISHVSYMHEPCLIYEWIMSLLHSDKRVLYLGRLGMGWLRLVASLKLQVSFAEYSLFYRTPLQTRPIILRSLLIVATP